MTRLSLWPRHRGRRALEPVAGVVAMGVLRQPVDEAPRERGLEAPGVPDDPAPRAERRTRVKERHCAKLSAGPRDGGGNDRDTVAGLGQRKQRLGIARLERDSWVDVRDAAGALEELAAAEALPQQEDMLAVELPDVERRAPRHRVPTRRGGEDPEREQQAALELVVAPPHCQAELDLAALDELDGAGGALLDEMDVDARPRPEVATSACSTS